MDRSIFISINFSELTATSLLTSLHSCCNVKLKVMISTLLLSMLQFLLELLALQ